jgi:hypothetical protein
MQAPRVLVPMLLCLMVAGRPALAGEAVAATDVGDAQASGEADPALASSAAPAPRWSASGLAERGSYRWSLSRGALDLGVRFEPRVAAALPIDARYDSAAPLGATLPSISVGLRSIAAPAPADSLIERALGSDSPGEESKVGIEWKPAQSQVFIRQGLGVRLGGDDRLVMRLRKSSIGIYMHRTF